MRLKLYVPDRVFATGGVSRVRAEGEHGSFTLLPAHIDCVAALVPGIFSCVRSEDGQEEYFGTDEGILVKCAGEITVSVRSAIRGPGLEDLRDVFERQLLRLDEREEKGRKLITRLESDFIRRLVEWQRSG
ncbi:MAG: F0F1 ATP synthase subunit epsilon [Candidatus Omnitrophica bacterium]|nr:F0F1 ATP synthase subunit epsilon [Candidatus Omnitrophota bacterium]